MKLLQAISELAGLPGPVFLAIGVFDGVHLGHQAVIGEAVKDAREEGGSAVVVTFDPHPQRILRPEAAPRILTSTPHKLQLLRQLGIAHTLLVKFDATFAATSPETFIRELSGASKPLGGICVGQQWSFGKNRVGNLDLLRLLGNELGFKVTGVPEVEENGMPVSSTLIRQAVCDGDLALASRLLGRPYGILGRVEHGEQLGAQLGFPTANLSAHSEQFPPDGVYAVKAILPEGTPLPAVANIGFRPTVGGKKRLLEVHIPNFSGDLYGQEIEAIFGEKLRGEIKFDSLEALKEQIAKDVKHAVGR